MSEQKAPDPSGDIMWMLAIILGLILLIGYFFHKEILVVYLTIRLKQIQLASLIFPTQTYLEYIQLIETRPIADWTFKEAFGLGGRIGYVMNIPLIGIIGWLTYKAWKSNPLQQLTRELNMNSLKESEQRLWPYIAPVVGIDLMAESFDKGPYAMAMKPYDFSVKYHLLAEEKNVNSLDRKRAEKLFISQLGKPWAGVNRLKKHERALLAIFAAHGCGDKKGAMKAINDIAVSAKIKGIKRMPDLSSADPLLHYLEKPEVKEVLNKHGYVFTVMAQMLEFSRITGVFPPSYMVWLKPRDRTLWYVINCVGRQVAYVEVGGIFSHWKAEQMAGHKIDAPFVIKAVDGLERALGEVKVV